MLPNHYIHGHSKKGATTSVYYAWSDMKKRCNNPKNKSYADYGGRGITYDKAWENFTVFLADMGEPPTGHTLDRIDNSLGYSKANCKWSTRLEQSKNRRFCIRICDGDEVLILKDMCKKYSMPYKTLYARHKWGWSPAEMFGTPIAHQCGPKKRKRIRDDRFTFANST